MAENLNSCHPHGKSRLVSRLPASAWPGFCRHLGGQPVEEDTLAHPFELSALKKKFPETLGFQCLSVWNLEIAEFTPLAVTL